jgi:crotonobetainyl-CoA:carnitine CoA-transferase CaiB-like acyl-CoA transferase
VLAARNPGVVMCSISGYGATGPYAHKAGHDLNYVGLAGVLAMGAEAPGHGPAMPGVQIADLAGGALWSATGILAALVGRARTGKGAHLDISMTEGALALLAAELGNLDCGARPTRGAETLNGGVACYGVYRTADDRYLSVGALEPKFYVAFCTAIGRKPDVSRADRAAGAAGGDPRRDRRGARHQAPATSGCARWRPTTAAASRCSSSTSSAAHPAARRPRGVLHPRRRRARADRAAAHAAGHADGAAAAADARRAQPRGAGRVRPARGRDRRGVRVTAAGA